jgi:truncated hemoglobin YjbI
MNNSILADAKVQGTFVSKKTLYLVQIVFFTTLGIFFTGNSSAQKANSLLGKTNFGKYLNEAPGLATSYDANARRALGDNLKTPDNQSLNKFYQPYRENIESVMEEYRSFYQNKTQNHLENKGEAEIKKEALNQANQNPVIAKAGGVEKLSKMSGKEAREALEKSADAYVQNPLEANGVSSPGMQAFYQKVMSDPAYAAKFEKMSEAEKMAEMQKYLQGEVIENQSVKFEKQMKNRQKTLNAMEIQTQLQKWMLNLNEASLHFDKDTQLIRENGQNHTQIEQIYEKEYAQIPLIVIGETREKDPHQVSQAINKKLDAHRQRAQNELGMFAKSLENLRLSYKNVIQDYQDFLAKNGFKVNDNLNDFFAGTNTELVLANFEQQLLGLSLDILKKSENLTSEVAQWEALYQTQFRK